MKALGVVCVALGSVPGATALSIPRQDDAHLLCWAFSHTTASVTPLMPSLLRIARAWANVTTQADAGPLTVSVRSLPEVEQT